MRVDNTADNVDITQSQAANHHRLLSHVSDTWPHLMQEVKILCTYSQALRDKYCIGGIAHNTVVFDFFC